MKINEIFGGPQVVQGEGPFAGEPATFIRVFGCVPPYCSFCDTKYSWNDEKNESKEMSIPKIVDKVKSFGKDKLIVITGGEPFAQPDIYNLIDALRLKGFNIQIETSGKAPITQYVGSRAVTVMSPKQYNGKFVLSKGVNLVIDAAYLKFVVGDEKEAKNVAKFIKKINFNGDNCYLMAKGETREKQLELMPKVFEWCNKYNLKYSPRLHVLAFNVKRGV